MPDGRKLNQYAVVLRIKLQVASHFENDIVDWFYIVWFSLQTLPTNYAYKTNT